MHKRIQSLTLVELKVLRVFLLFKKIKRYIQGRGLKQALKLKLYNKYSQDKNILRQNRLRVICHEEGVKLFWDNLELTQSVGLNASLNIFGLWYDSSKAKWEILKQAENELIMKNVWRNIPIAQRWHILLMPDYSIRWRIDFLIDSKIEIEESKASIMLSSLYGKWNTLKEKGGYPLSMNWSEVDLSEKNAQSVCVEKVKVKDVYLPQMCFDFSESEPARKLQLQNSDKIINARIISAVCVEADNGKVFLPGEYKYFSGKITIKDNDA